MFCTIGHGRSLPPTGGRCKGPKKRKARGSLPRAFQAAGIVPVIGLCGGQLLPRPHSLDLTLSNPGSKNAPGFLRPNAPFWNDTQTLTHLGFYAIPKAFNPASTISRATKSREGIFPVSMPR